ncbi:MAG TPA: class I SAM-dependent methyltransferase [Candidatus Limnocylindrales bacterium]|nr:class I SAM-dependent methyltransferase [Candidatus Limnocylindrales bacterium]
MTDFHRIYREHAREYEAMVSVEDEAGNVPALIWEICPPEGKVVLDIGAGTGRLTMLTAPTASRVIAVDRSAAMLMITRERAAHAGYGQVELIVCDHRILPLPSRSVDLALAGWTFGHSTLWDHDWKTEIGRSLDEAFRMLRPGAPLIVFETLGTGGEMPAPPNETLAEFYAWLVDNLGFQHRTIRTDYRFNNPQQGADLTRFFFGDDLADRILAEGMTVLPECTGCWWKFKA